MYRIFFQFYMRKFFNLDRSYKFYFKTIFRSIVWLFVYLEQTDLLTESFSDRMIYRLRKYKIAHLLDLPPVTGVTTIGGFSENDAKRIPSKKNLNYYPKKKKTSPHSLRVSHGALFFHRFSRSRIRHDNLVVYLSIF